MVSKEVDKRGKMEYDNSTLIFFVSSQRDIQQIAPGRAQEFREGENKTNNKNNQKFALRNAIEIRLFISCTQSEI